MGCEKVPFTVKTIYRKRDTNVICTTTKIAPYTAANYHPYRPHTGRSRCSRWRMDVFSGVIVLKNVENGKECEKKGYWCCMRWKQELNNVFIELNSVK
jgi:hypothetical protein